MKVVLPFYLIPYRYKSYVSFWYSIFTYIFVIFPSVIILISTPAYAADERARFGLWIEAEGTHKPYDSLEGFKGFEKFVDRDKFTDLYCQVHRGGRSWFASSFADDYPYQNAKKQGFDPLGDTIKQAHARGQKVHAWVNVLRVAKNKKAPILLKLGKKAALRDNFGNSLVDYDANGYPPGKARSCGKLDTPGIWLDPYYDDVRAHLVGTIRELIAQYPELDGIHLDMMRHPFVRPSEFKDYEFKGSESDGKSKKCSLKLGYAKEALDAFREFSNDELLKSSLSRGHVKLNSAGANVVDINQWTQWRQSYVTLLVFEIKQVLLDLAPHMELSVAALPALERANTYAFQDWDGWLRSGIIDTVIPMGYTRDTKLFSSYAKSAIGIRDEDKKRGQVLMGIGAWLLLREPSLLSHEIKIANDAKSDGVVLFSYSNLQGKLGDNLLKQTHN